MQAVDTRIMKGIEYPLVAMALTKSQCREIKKPLIQAVKMALELQKWTSISIMQGTMEEMGMNLQDMYDIQGRRKMMYLANNGHKEQAMEALLRAMHQALIMETGIGGNMFEKDHNK